MLTERTSSGALKALLNWYDCIALNETNASHFIYPFNAGIKSRRAKLHDEILCWGFGFLNRAFH
jgi:hypothetical protein